MNLRGHFLAYKASLPNGTPHPFEGDDEPVRLGNIAYATDDPATPADESKKLLVSLINVQEEFTMKNMPAVRKSGINLEYKNPPVFLNLFVLFSASFSNYTVALKTLSLVMGYFQGNNKFSFSSHPVMETLGSEIFTEEVRSTLNMSLDLCSLTFEQINHLWGSLGGKQVPFVLYKARLVEVDVDLKQKGGGIIQEIQTTYP